MKYIYNLAFKMSISATIALLIGNALGLQYATVGAVIAILSIQDTRKKALIISYKRIIACSMGILLSVMLYSLLGNGTLIFGLFLIVLIPLTSRLKAQEGMVPAVVLSTHFLVANNITIELIFNEVLLMIIGIGVAAIANIFMPSLEDKFKDDKEWIEEHYRIIINKMSKSLITHAVDIDEQKLINAVEERLYTSKETAYKIVNNQFFKSSSYYTDYINMRINQFDTIKRMRLHFQRFNIPVEQMNVMADFTLCVSENISEMNDCKSLLMDLEILRIEFKKMELPKTREEFESRAQLLQFLNDMEEFLLIKRNFFTTMKNH
ncbi:aromatic acid exporter family protein [Clostridium sp.]|uniref:aromatic acid exporter family protein n=1 Tax=Clostridium sp. TaxID=1506 RepID=UPI0025C34BA1|nr:aromatic acid exporter family protein [Clostridium sp.]MBS4958465.1 aromatic acid exporter family protein [Clostridium sp.]MDU4884750.1 aromatic acid exporter family protein [Clostridium celatum]MDU7077968.1 aromatic acid exporter family protein [Clostridium celatum]